MGVSVAQYKKELLREIEDLSFGKVKEILNYVHFIKAKDVIDPSQSYFWTRNWQAMEKEADRDKKAGNIIGDGTVNDLIKKLKK
jgi:hypothetical protein